MHDYANALVETALRMGAVHAVPFSIEDIAFDPRTLLKCMFGCEDWGKLHTCPSRPGTPSMAEYRDMFSRYRWGVIVHAHDVKTSQDISYELERLSYLEGFALAFSLSDCHCCKTCAGVTGDPCRNVKKARPAFHSVGIDVFTTVHRLGLPLYPLQDASMTQNWYSAVFVE